MSAITDLSKLPPGEKAFFVHVRFRVAGNGTVYQLLLNHLNGGERNELFSTKVRHDDQVSDLPLGQYIVAGPWGIGKVFDRAERVAGEVAKKGTVGPGNAPNEMHRTRR